MKAYLEIELFGEDTRQLTKLYANITNEIIQGLGEATFGSMPASGWVAEITGFDPKYKYCRKFLKYKKEYSRSNSKGSRGIMAEYILESEHIYQVKSQTSWKNVRKYFCIVNENGDIIEISEEEVSNRFKKLGHEPIYKTASAPTTDSKQTYYAALNMTVVGDLTDDQKEHISKTMNISKSKINKRLIMLCERMDAESLLKSLQNGKFAYSSVNNTHHSLWVLLIEDLIQYNYCADITKVSKVKTEYFIKGVELWQKNRSGSMSLQQPGNE